MRTPFVLAVILAYAVSLCSMLASDPKPAATDATLAEQLGRMGCRIELGFVDGKVTVERVSASGKITSDRMSTEPLPQELFDCLGRLSGLRSLHLDVKGGEKDRASLRDLAKFQNLRHLELFGQDVNDEVMISVAALTNLESLTLWDVSVGEQGLVRLARLKALKRLELGDFTKINSRGVEAVAKLQGLEYLRVYGDIEKGALSALNGLPKLETIGIGGAFISRLLSELKAISTIQRVEIERGEVDAAAAEHLHNMKTLQFLKLHCCGVTPDAVKIIQSLQLHQIECVGIATDVLSELARGMSKCYGDLNVWN